MATTVIFAIVGPTATGKSDLSLKLALDFGGEIICADSRTIYRHLDIATAKPTESAQQLVPHHMLDVRNVGETMTVRDYQHEAEVLIEDIKRRGRIPILVGGSGLYVDSVLYAYRFPGSRDRLRQELEELSLQQLVVRLKRANPEAAESVDLANHRRVIRAIETTGLSRSKLNRVRPDAVVIGLFLHRDEAKLRVRARIQGMIDDGLLAEVRHIGDTYGWESSAFDIIGYRAMKPVVLHAISLKEGIDNFVASDMALFKKQVTWFKRNSDIRWLNALSPNLFQEASAIMRSHIA